MHLSSIGFLIINLIKLGEFYFAGSSNGRTAAFGAVNFGSNPSPAANQFVPMCKASPLRKWKVSEDFLVEYQDGSKELHETKGLPLLLWISTKLKGESAEEYCKKQGWKYKRVTKGSLAFYGKID